MSVKNRHALRDLTGDPWNARTLEWAVASPAAYYNFAHTPIVHDKDTFWEMKRARTLPAKEMAWRRIHLLRRFHRDQLRRQQLCRVFRVRPHLARRSEAVAVSSTAGMLINVITHSFNGNLAATTSLPTKLRGLKEVIFNTCPRRPEMTVQSRLDVASAALGADEHEEHHDDGSTTTLGFWIYLMSDCILFSAVFAAFAVLRDQTAGGPTPRELFSLPYVHGRDGLPARVKLHLWHGNNYVEQGKRAPTCCGGWP